MVKSYKKFIKKISSNYRNFFNYFFFFFISHWILLHPMQYPKYFTRSESITTKCLIFTCHITLHYKKSLISPFDSAHNNDLSSLRDKWSYQIQ